MHDVCMEVSNVFILAALSQIFLSSYAGKRNREHLRYVTKILEYTLKNNNNNNVFIDPTNCSFDSFF